MSKYTTQVRFICETAAGYTEQQDANMIDEIVNQTADALIGSYPIFDESYRHALNCKIIKHYYLREIGQETAGVWKFFLNRKMNEIMPYYNQLYKSELLEFNPLYDVDVFTEHKGDGAGQTVSTGTGTSTESTIGRTDSENREVTGEKTDTLSMSESRSADKSDRANEHWDLFQDTPQGGLDGVEDQEYLTDARKITDEEGISGSSTASGKDETSGERTVDTTGSAAQQTTGSRESESATNNRSEYTNIDQYMDHVFGKRGGMTYSAMLGEFRETFLNIDMLIIEELEDLFFQLW